MSKGAAHTIAEAVCEAQAVIDDYLETQPSNSEPHVLVQKLRTILDDEAVLKAMKDVGYFCA